MDQESTSGRFKTYFNTYITRPGAAGLLGWMEDNGFFAAPASKGHHGAKPGGLAAHSVNVFERLGKIAAQESREPVSELRTESIAVVGLLHDLCKIDEYEKAGSYGYQMSHHFPVGHGEKSVILIMRHMQLTDEETLAIRWHMGQYDFSARGGSYDLDHAFKKCPLAVMLHIADMMAAHFDEGE